MIGKKCWNCHRTFKDTSASVRRSIPELSAVACLEKRWMFCGEAFIGLDYFRLKEPPILYPLLMPRKNRFKQVQSSNHGFHGIFPWKIPSHLLRASGTRGSPPWTPPLDAFAVEERPHSWAAPSEHPQHQRSWWQTMCQGGPCQENVCIRERERERERDR